MRALTLFFLKSGGRIAVQSYAPLFSALVAWIMLNMYPAEMVRRIAGALFAPRPEIASILPLAALAFLLPAWAALRLSVGLNGWIRHLPVSDTELRRGLVLSLAIVQAPLAGSLFLLGVVASGAGLEVVLPLLRHLLVLAAGAAAALPVRRRPAVFALALAAAGTASAGSVWTLPLAPLLLVAADAVAGPLRVPCRPSPRPSSGTLFELRIAWRAVRLRVLRAYAAGLAAIGAAALFVSNNPLPPPLLSAAVRFGTAFAAALFLSVLAHELAVRRPVWPWARSLPYSSGQRIAADTLILGIASLPVALPALLLDGAGAAAALLTIPFVAVRAAGYVRTIPERRTGSAVILAEGFAVSAVLALFPWSAAAWMAAAVPAFRWARAREARQKVTRWLELHHTAAGDPMSWSG